MVYVCGFTSRRAGICNVRVSFVETNDSVQLISSCHTNLFGVNTNFGEILI